ncbi:MAG TPA: thioredoxin family protein [candidate division WOR-3 bacterium]|uniref:Thioredoxin family protein n=1 Tax=candidate division WOR-3 bacterium TaxID=2052148 RepID=A0A7V0T7S9_UNCW3|nr:thioredoxin family protein [candidate division WOR-3 bacterium]
MKVQVLGIGCARCQELEKRVRDTLAEMNLAAEVEHVKDLKTIAAMGVLMTPGLMIDGKVVAQGKIPSKEDLKKLLSGGQ